MLDLQQVGELGADLLCALSADTREGRVISACVRGEAMAADVSMLDFWGMPLQALMG